MHRVLAPLIAAWIAMTVPATNVGDIAVCAVTERVSHEHYQFTGHCPRFSGIGDGAVQKTLNAKMRERMEEAHARAKAAAAALPTDDRSEQPKVEAVYSYEVKRNSNGVVSLLFSDTLYTGGANGQETQSGMSFHTGSGKVILLPDLFYNSERGLREINDEVKRQLGERGLEKALADANPVVDKQQTFYLTDTHLVLVIAERTWFPHSMGTVELSLPLTLFAGGLKTEYTP